MSRRPLHGALVLAIVVMLAAPAPAASPVGSAADACRSSERDRFVIRRPPLPADSDPSTLPVTCLAQHVVQALREGKPVDLEHVALKGTLDLGAAAARTLQIDLPLRRDTQRQRQQLDKWCDERRRDHRAADTLADQAGFRVISVPISIRQSWIESIDGGGGDPLFLLEAVDLRGTRIKGALSLPGAIFKGPVDLAEVRVAKWLSFAGAHFDAGLDFSRARVGGAANFAAATFGAREMSRPRDPRLLGETPALFTAATFEGAASFREAVFESRADYQKTTFTGDADFSTSRFQERADFGHARFMGPLDAAQAVFERDARFPNATFDKQASFLRAEFRWRADFGLAAFTDATSTLREARFGPSVARLLSESPANPQGWLPRFLGEERTGYDFRHANFTDRTRTLARSDFEIHGVFAVATFLSAGLGLLVCWVVRRRPLIRWRAVGSGPAVAAIADVGPRVAGSFTSMRASPREQLADASFLLAAYALLAVGLAVHYQTQTGSAVDLWVALAYPVAGLLAWTGVLCSVRAAVGYRARQLHGRQRPPKPLPSWLDYFEPEYHVPRRCDHFVAAFVSRISTGVLGLAGLPGVGRSWLARAVLEGRVATQQRHDGTSPGDAPDPILALRTSSPLKGDLLPFFTLLFRRVGEEAKQKLRRSLFTPLDPHHPSRHADAAEELIEPPPVVALVPLGVMLAATAAILAFPWRPPAHGSVRFEWTLATLVRVATDVTPILLLVSVALLTSAYYSVVWSRANLRKALHTRDTGRLYIATEQVLERLAFEESTSDERGASVAMHGFGFQRRRSRALKERPITLPVFLADFQRYVEELRTVYRGGVVVHIEDADRIADLADVRELLVRLKATLVGGVLYLVPLPDNVLDGQRARATAGVVAGLLDDVVVVPPMTTLDGLRMLARRGFFPGSKAEGAEPPSKPQSRDGLGLAICLVSGGIPKEILRLLRRVSTDGNDWTVDLLLERTRQEARDAPTEALTELRRKLDLLSTWENGLIDNKNLHGDEPWDGPADLEAIRELETIRRAFLANAMGAPT